MKTLLIVLVTLTSAVFAFPKSKSDTRIIGGNDAVRDQFPYTVIVNDTKGIIRGGVIIGQRWVLCIGRLGVLGYKPYDLEVIAGALVRTETTANNEQPLPVVQIIPHPLYSKDTASYDISILRLSSLLIYGANVQAIALAPKNYSATGLATISGWGYTEVKGAYATTLQYAYVEILNKTACQSALTAAGKNLSSYDSTINLCTSPPTKTGKQSAATGDQGGPLVIGNYLVGVLVADINNWLSTPSLYTNVSVVRDWILNNTNGEIED